MLLVQMVEAAGLITFHVSNLHGEEEAASVAQVLGLKFQTNSSAFEEPQNFRPTSTPCCVLPRRVYWTPSGHHLLMSRREPGEHWRGNKGSLASGMLLLFNPKSWDWRHRAANDTLHLYVTCARSALPLFPSLVRTACCRSQCIIACTYMRNSRKAAQTRRPMSHVRRAAGLHGIFQLKSLLASKPAV